MPQPIIWLSALSEGGSCCNYIPTTVCVPLLLLHMAIPSQQLSPPRSSAQADCSPQPPPLTARGGVSQRRSIASKVHCAVYSGTLHVCTPLQHANDRRCRWALGRYEKLQVCHVPGGTWQYNTGLSPLGVDPAPTLLPSSPPQKQPAQAGRRQGACLSIQRTRCSSSQDSSAFGNGPGAYTPSSVRSAVGALLVCLRTCTGIRPCIGIVTSRGSPLVTRVTRRSPN